MDCVLHGFAGESDMISMLRKSYHSSQPKPLSVTYKPPLTSNGPFAHCPAPQLGTAISGCRLKRMHHLAYIKF